MGILNSSKASFLGTCQQMPAGLLLQKGSRVKVLLGTPFGKLYGSLRLKKRRYRVLGITVLSSQDKQNRYILLYIYIYIFNVNGKIKQKRKGKQAAISANSEHKDNPDGVQKCSLELFLFIPCKGEVHGVGKQVNIRSFSFSFFLFLLLLVRLIITQKKKTILLP